MNPDIARRSDRLDRLVAVLAGMDAQARSVADLLEAVPGLICRLGFDRAVVTRVEDGGQPSAQAEPNRDLQPVLVRGVASYVAAPIVSGGQVIGNLRADCQVSGREVDEVDRDILGVFAVALRLALALAQASAAARAPADRLPETLTEREREVLRLMAAGCTNLAIAQRLQIADGTAKKHVLRVLRKLEVTNRSEAVARWFRSGEAPSAQAAQ